MTLNVNHDDSSKMNLCRDNRSSLTSRMKVLIDIKDITNMMFVMLVMSLDQPGMNLPQPQGYFVIESS